MNTPTNYADKQIEQYNISLCLSGILLYCLKDDMTHNRCSLEKVSGTKLPAGFDFRKQDGWTSYYPEPGALTNLAH